MPTINRIVSQSGKEGTWRKDKQAMLASLADFGFYTFADLHYFDDNQTILATFPNFRTDDIVQGHTIGYWKEDQYEPFGLAGGYARVYINIVGTYKPVKASMRQSLTFAHEGYDDYIPAVDSETNETIEYAIQDVRTLENQIARGISVDATGTPTGWDYDVEGVAMLGPPPEHDHWALLYPYVWFDNSSLLEADWIINEWYHTIPTLTYIVMKRDLDLNGSDILLGRKGLDWHNGLGNIYTPQTWQIIYPAWTDVDIVINDARFTKLDKQYRWE